MKAMRALSTRIGFVSAMNFSRQTNSLSTLADAHLFLRSRGLDQVSYLNNSTMMDVDFLPEHLIVIGGSYVGLEFAQMYRRFGSEVTDRGEGAATDSA